MLGVRNRLRKAFVMQMSDVAEGNSPRHDAEGVCVSDAYTDQGRSPRRRRSSSVQRVACRTLRRVLRVRVSRPVWSWMVVSRPSGWP